SALRRRFPHGAGELRLPKPLQRLRFVRSCFRPCWSVGGESLSLHVFQRGLHLGQPEPLLPESQRLPVRKARFRCSKRRSWVQDRSTWHGEACKGKILSRPV